MTRPADPQLLHRPVLDLAIRPVLHCGPQATLIDAARLMAAQRISFVPILDAGQRPLGIVTETDLLAALHHQLDPDTPLTEVAQPATTVAQERSIESAYRLSAESRTGHLVVVDAHGRTVAVVSKTDFRVRLNLGTLAGRHQVQSVMTPVVHTGTPHDPLDAWLDWMYDAPESCLIVVEHDRPVGILTARDTTRIYAEGLDPLQLTLGAIMSQPLHTVPTDATLNAAADLMLAWHIRHLVVVHGDGRLAGLITEHELTRILAVSLMDAALVQERNRQHAVLAAIPDLVWLKDPDGVYLSCNPRFEQFFGASEAEIRGKTDHDFVPIELADFFRRHDLHALANNAPTVNEEVVTFASDGHRELLHTIKTPVHDHDGTLVGVLGIGRNITELRRAQDEYRLLFDRNPVAMAIYAHTTLDILKVNDAFQRLYGYSHEEARRLLLTDLGLPEQRDAIRARIESLQGLSDTSEWPSLRRDGSRIEVMAQSHDIAHEGHACRLITITDITALRRSQQRERRRLALLERLAHGAALPELLEQLVHDHEAQFPQSLCSILLLEASGRHLRHGAAPNLPASYNALVDGLEIGPGVGSCGAAIHSGQRVVATDLATDPNWAPFRAATAAAGLGACWSEPIFGAPGQPLGTFAIYRREPASPTPEEIDHLAFSVQLAATAITHAQTGQRLRDSEQRLADILRAIPDLVWLQDRDGVVQNGNAAFARQAGRSTEEIIGLPIDMLLGAEAAAALRDGDARALASGQPASVEHWLSPPGGGPTSLYETIKTPQYDTSGRLSGVLGVARNITLIKQGARAIAEQERLIDTMFGQTTDSIVLHDPETLGIVTFNDAACQGLGYSREAFSRMTPADYQLDFPIERILATVQRVQAGEEINAETRHRRADGSVQHAALRLRRLSYAGRPLISAVWRDITDNKQREARIERVNRAYALLSAVNEAIVRTRDAQPLYAEVCRIAVEVGGLRMAWIGRLSDSADTVEVLASAGHDEGYIEGHLAPLREAEHPIAAALMNGQPLIVNDLERAALPPERLAAARQRGYRAAAVFPITLASRSNHGLTLYADTPDYFDPEQVALLTRLAQDLGFAHELGAAETATREEQRLREQLMESVAGLFYAIDPRGHVVLWNRRFEEVTGYSPNEIASRHASDYFGAPDRERILAGVTEVFERGEGRVEAVLLSKSGRRIPHLFVSRRVDLAPEPLIVGTGIDISERVRTEQELARHRQHLEELVVSRTAELEAANARLNREDQRLRAMLHLSQQASTLDEASLLQRSIDEIIQITGNQGGCLHTVQQGRLVWAAWAGCTAQAVRATAELRPADGRLLPWQQVYEARQPMLLNNMAGLPEVQRLLCVPVVEDDQVRLVICAANKPTPYDASDERELVLLGRDLWRIIRRRRIELDLEQAKTVADAASQAKSAFLANMSHEIRTPMNAIMGFNHLLRRDPLTARQRDYLDKSADASQHLLQVINDILDFSKIEAHKVHLELVDFDLHASVERIIGMLLDKARAKQVRLSARLDGCPRQLRGDRLRLEQILLNLVANAVKFTPQGHIELRLRALHEDAERVVLRVEVEDSGIGIAAAQIPHLFEAFEQADATMTRRFGGTGLGLAISKRLLQLMDGRIGVNSTPGHGSTFWFEVPLQHAQGAIEPARPAAAAGSAPRGARILLVEDHPINQKVTADLLGTLGLSVDLADQGEMAVTLASREHYDLILMDVQMPVMDGLQATRLIRQLPGGASIPIIAMTANAFEEDRQRCLDAGMNDYLAKPVDPALFEQRLANWLGRPEPSAAPAPTGAATHLPQPLAVARSAPPPAARPASSDPASAAAAQARLHSVPGLDVPTALGRLRGNLTLYLRTLDLFLTHHAADAAQLLDPALSADRQRLRHVAHTLAGAAATIGADALHQQARRVEALARDPAAALTDTPELARLHAELTGFTQALQAALRPAAATPDPATHDWPRVLASLQALRPMLVEHDTSAADTFEHDRALLGLALGALAGTLDEQIQDFNFQAALHSLDEALRVVRSHL